VIFIDGNIPDSLGEVLSAMGGKWSEENGSWDLLSVPLQEALLSKYHLYNPGYFKVSDLESHLRNSLLKLKLERMTAMTGTIYLTYDKKKEIMYLTGDIKHILHKFAPLCSCSVGKFDSSAAYEMTAKDEVALGFIFQFLCIDGLPEPNKEVAFDLHELGEKHVREKQYLPVLF
jgi:hypothetical protein